MKDPLNGLLNTAFLITVLTTSVVGCSKSGDSNVNPQPVPVAPLVDSDCQIGQSETRQRSLSNNVAYGQTCSTETQTRTCNNGLWSSWTGTYNQESCSVLAPATCDGWPHGHTANQVRYAQSNVAFGSACQAETQTRTCNNGSWGQWSGTFTQTVCSVGSALPCGTAAHGTFVSRTRFQTSEVLYGFTCKGETQIQSCNNGTWTTWSGTFSNTNCSVALPLACDGSAHGALESRIRYRMASVPFESTCQQETQSRNCNNGSWGAWSGTYTQSNCVISSPLNCDGLMHNQQTQETFYNDPRPPYPRTCMSETKTISCYNGILSFPQNSFQFKTCLAGNAEDTDADGLTNTNDNCPSHYNPSQRDSNSNGSGDDCDQDTAIIVETIND